MRVFRKEFEIPSPYKSSSRVEYFVDQGVIYNCLHRSSAEFRRFFTHLVLKESLYNWPCLSQVTVRFVDTYVSLT